MGSITLVVMTVLCLVYPPTRMYGFAGLAMLVGMYHFFLTPLLLVAGITYYYLHNRKRKNHELSDLSSGSR